MVKKTPLQVLLTVVPAFAVVPQAILSTVPLLCDWQLPLVPAVVPFGKRSDALRGDGAPVKEIAAELFGVVRLRTTVPSPTGDLPPADRATKHVVTPVVNSGIVKLVPALAPLPGTLHAFVSAVG